MCYGMAALMGLLYTRRIDINKIEAYASHAADLSGPIDNRTLFSYLSYYHFLQWAIDSKWAMAVSGLHRQN